MGRYTFIILFFGIIGLIAVVVPHESQVNGIFITRQNDSTELKKQSIYICKGHYFEWCDNASNCSHCSEPLTQLNLWEYYTLLECEDPQKFLEDNYQKIIQNKIKL
ncbi:MAG: hypothetical protein COA58_15100 [Bacteroidetes bacterium]|nr:MAG: hypothetical protein COA58_15100 [Bacteroidota bacterium]